MKTPRTRGMLLLLTLLCASCQSFAPRAPLPVTAQDNTARLIQHPQFKAAAQAAPDFVKDALATITRLEREKADAGKR